MMMRGSGVAELGAGPHAVLGAGPHAVLGVGPHAVLGAGPHAVLGAGTRPAPTVGVRVVGAALVAARGLAMAPRDGAVGPRHARPMATVMTMATTAVENIATAAFPAVDLRLISGMGDPLPSFVFRPPSIVLRRLRTPE